MLAFALALIVAVSAEECQKICTMQYDPICGTDGKTYSNMCQLNSMACTLKAPIRMAYKGMCTGRQNACPRICTMQYDPVCGSDGKTYDNKCQLESQACVAKSNVQVQHQGACVPKVASACPRICTMQYDPVCGSDGKTYGNKCQLESQACVAKSNVKIAYQGACVVVETPAKSDSEEYCEMKCTFQYDPVCGSDGKTYSNKCQLEKQAIQAKSNTKMAYQGACVKCPKICTFEYSPVCGSDGVTYGNECQLTAQSCAARKQVVVAKQGVC